jgi:hypothetical protein
MPSLLASPFPSLIQAIPASEHSIQINAAFWQEKFSRAGQTQLWTAIFSNNSSIRLTRGRLLTYQYPDQNQKCVEILLWGYPSDMRGLVSHLLPAPLLNQVVNHAQSRSEWPDYWDNFDAIGRIGISTITKLAYFYQKSFGEHKALILDSRLIEATARWKETIIPGLSYITARHHYLKYLDRMYAAATSISCTGAQLELFLFALGDGF